jgi:methylmalonyl-CoA mutase N-terminal domain/subunit
LAGVKERRDQAAVAAALASVTATAKEPDANLMPPIVDAVRAYATVGEIIGAMEGVFGRYRETTPF